MRVWSQPSSGIHIIAREVDGKFASENGCCRARFYPPHTDPFRLVQVSCFSKPKLPSLTRRSPAAHSQLTCTATAQAFAQVISCPDGKTAGNRRTFFRLAWT